MNTQSTIGTVSQAVKNAFRGINDQMQACIQTCFECELICRQTISYCLKQGGAHAEVRHIQLLQDCADICSTSARVMARESKFQSQTCSLCAEICLACAEECEKMGDDEIMKSCAEACRRCADSCRKMAAH